MKAWNSKVAQDKEKLVKLSVSWPAGKAEPKPVRINIDGQGYQCMTGGAPSVDVGNEDLTEDEEAPAESQAPVAEESKPNPPEIAAITAETDTERGIFAKWPKKASSSPCISPKNPILCDIGYFVRQNVNLNRPCLS